MADRQPQDGRSGSGTVGATAQGVTELWVKGDKEEQPATLGVAETRTRRQAARVAATAWRRRWGFPVHEKAGQTAGLTEVPVQMIFD